MNSGKTYFSEGKLACFSEPKMKQKYCVRNGGMSLGKN